MILTTVTSQSYEEDRDMNISKLLKKIKMLRNISVPKFIYYNYICKSIKRDSNCYIIPNKNSIINIDKTAKVFLYGHLILNAHKLKGSKAECYLLLRKKAVLNVQGTVDLYYNTTIQVFEDAILSLGQLGANSGTVIVCKKKISIGNGALIARDVLIYDSDHHSVVDDTGKQMSKDKEVIIDDNVWIGAKATILKGVKIGEGAIISANSWVVKSVPSHSLVACLPARQILNDVSWKV